MARVLARYKAPRPPDTRTPAQRTASRKADIVFGTLYVLSAATVRTVPSARWSVFPDLLARYQTRRAGEKSRQFRQGVRALLGDELDDKAIMALFAQNLAHGLRRSLLVAALRRRKGWDPSIVLDGRERLEAALARGRGAMLWFDGFAHAAIVGKRAFADAGFSMWHLSARGHGIVNSRFGEYFLNRRVIEVELRYLAGRIVFDETSAATATRRMIGILAGNGIVSLTNNAYIGTAMEVPFGTTAKLPLARTPLHLAASRGIPLFPVSAIEVEPYARYEVSVGADLTASILPADPDPIARIAKAYADYQLPLALAYPAQWGGWEQLRRS